MTHDKINVGSDPLHEYRILKLEEAYAQMAESVAALVSEVKAAKWVVGLFLGVGGPVSTAMIVHFLTKG